MISAEPINKKWYRYYNRNGASSLTSTMDCAGYFVVYKVNSNGYRNYAAFRNSIDFFYHLQSNNRITEYHEVIPGNGLQKPRFDIDLTTEAALGKNLVELGTTIRNSILQGIERVINGLGLEINIETDVGVYTAHSDDVDDPAATDAKFSCHIVLHNFCHQGFEEAKEFCRMVVVASESDDVALAYDKGIIDSSIYKSTCSLRMLYSLKAGKRPKLPVFRYRYQDRIIDWTSDIREPGNLLKIFRDSAVTDVSDCTILPISVPERKKNYVEINLPEDALSKIDQALIQSEGDVYEIGEMRGPLIILKRLHPSYCDICRRNHDLDNPYLRISADGSIMFYCRRAAANNNSKVIGYLNGVEAKQTPVSFNESSIDNTETEVVQPKKPNRQLNMSMLDKISSQQILSSIRPQVQKDDISFSDVDISNIDNLPSPTNDLKLSFSRVLDSQVHRVPLQ